MNSDSDRNLFGSVDYPPKLRRVPQHHDGQWNSTVPLPPPTLLRLRLQFLVETPGPNRRGLFWVYWDLRLNPAMLQGVLYALAPQRREYNAYFYMAPPLNRSVDTVSTERRRTCKLLLLLESLASSSALSIRQKLRPFPQDLDDPYHKRMALKF